MAAVDEADLGMRIVALEGFGAERQKEWVVLAPDRQQGRVPGARRLPVFLDPGRRGCLAAAP
jgi:hypothetical protein